MGEIAMVSSSARYTADVGEALGALAEVVKRPGDAPAMPDGAVASAEQMRKAQREAEKYLLQAEAYMECEVMNRRQHEALADKMDELSERYNEEMIKYQVRTSFAAGK